MAYACLIVSLVFLPSDQATEQSDAVAERRNSLPLPRVTPEKVLADSGTCGTTNPQSGNRKIRRSLRCIRHSHDACDGSRRLSSRACQSGDARCAAPTTETEGVRYGGKSHNKPATRQPRHIRRIERVFPETRVAAPVPEFTWVAQTPGRITRMPNSRAVNCRIANPVYLQTENRFDVRVTMSPLSGL